MIALTPPSLRDNLLVGSIPTKFKPQPYMELPAWLLILTLICIALAILAILTAILLPRLFKAREKRLGEETQIRPKKIWQEKVNQVVYDHEQGKITRDQAMKELAGIARAFASQSWHQDMSTKTLAEITTQPRTTSTSRGLDLLRQTIDALYPPEFSIHGGTNGSGPISVAEAADWVISLIERWR